MTFVTFVTSFLLQYSCYDSDLILAHVDKHLISSADILQSKFAKSKKDSKSNFKS